MSIAFLPYKSWKIELSKIPKYPEFEGEFNVKLDKPIIELLLNSGSPNLTKEIKSMLRNTVLSNLSDDGTLKVNHSQRHRLGRFYPDADISLIPHSKYIKHTVFAYLGWMDIDMVKGHPTIALEMARKLNRVTLKLPAFEHYVGNFDKTAEELIEFYSVAGEEPLDKDDIKWLFVMMIYGGGFQTWLSGITDDTEEKRAKGYLPKKVKNTGILHPTAAAFNVDCTKIADEIYKTNTYMVMQLKKEGENTYKTKSRVVSYWFQTIENHIVYLVYDFLVQRNIITPRTEEPEYDGLCIPPVGFHFDKDELIADVNSYVKLMTGMDVKFKFKEYDAKYVLADIIEQRKAMEGENDDDDNTSTEEEDDDDDSIVGVVKAVEVARPAPTVEVKGVKNDKQAAERLFELYPHWVYCLGELYVFDDATGLWNSDEFTHFKVISKYEEHLHILREGKDGKMVKSPKGYGNTTTLMRQLIPQLKALNINNEWLKEKQSSSLGKLLFKNGFLDMKTKKFYDFDPEIVFMFKIPHAFEQFDDEDMEYMKSVEERLFTTPLGKSVADYLILNLARGLAGDVMKRILFGLGGSNCGKSVLTKALSSALGEYCGSFNAECLAHSNSSADEAAQMRWVYLLRYKRIIFSNEIKTKLELNGNMIKKISSGGDTLIAREHCKAEVEFAPQFLAMCMANDLPKITPYDDAVSKRVRVIPFTREFVDEPSNELELKKDEGIEKEIGTERFKRVFVGMLVWRYFKYLEDGMVEPECNEVIRAKCDWIGDDGEVGFVSKFLQEYAITNDKNDFILSSDIEDWLQRQKLGISMKKFGMELKRYCAIKKHDNVENKLKKINKKPTQAWFGMKSIELCEEEEVEQVDE